MPSYKTRLTPHSGIAPPFLVVAQAGVSRLHNGIPQEVRAHRRQGPMKKLGPRVTGMLSDVLDLP